MGRSSIVQSGCTKRACCQKILASIRHRRRRCPRIQLFGPYLLVRLQPPGLTGSHFTEITSHATAWEIPHVRNRTGTHVKENRLGFVWPTFYPLWSASCSQLHPCPNSVAAYCCLADSGETYVVALTSVRFEGAPGGYGGR